MTQAKRLRNLLEAPGFLVLPGVYDCISAKLVEQTGFEVAFTSGFGISASLLGRPDFGFLTATESLSAVGHIAGSVDIPVVADIDTGYGNPLNVFRTVSDAVSLGIGGVIIEDQEWPKRCGHFEGKRVISRAEHVEKICAAVEARADSELVIIGRTDARAVKGLAAAIDRGHAYAEAGADVVFVEAPRSLDELRTIASSFPGVPTFANMVEGGKTPLLSATDLEDLGFKIAVFPLTGLFAATKAVSDAFRYLRKHGTTAGLDLGLTFHDFEQVVETPKYREMERQFSAKK